MTQIISDSGHHAELVREHSEDERNLSIQSKFKLISKRFEGFESALKAERDRKLAEQRQKIDELREAVDKVRQSVREVVTNRVEHVEEVQTKLQRLIEQDWLVNQPPPFHEKLDALDVSLESLFVRLEELSNKAEKNNETLKVLIQQRVHSVRDKLEGFQKEYELTQQQSDEKYPRTISKLEHNDQSHFREFEKERLKKDEEMNHLLCQIKPMVQRREVESRELRKQIQQHLTGLQKSVDEQRQVGIQTQRELLDQIEKYSKRLHCALHIVNTPL